MVLTVLFKSLVDFFFRQVQYMRMKKAGRPGVFSRHGQSRYDITVIETEL